MNYYKHFFGSYSKKTKALTILQHGVYRLLLDEYYIREEALPSDTKEVARMIGARTRAEIAAVNLILEKFFELRSSGWVHLRCEEDLAEYRHRIAASSKGGKNKGKKGNSSEVYLKSTSSTPEVDLKTTSSPLPSESQVTGASLSILHTPYSNLKEKEDARASEGGEADSAEHSEYDRLLALWESIRRRDPERDPARLVNDFERGHLTNMYFGHGFDKVHHAIDAIGQLGWYATVDQIREYLKTGKVSKPEPTRTRSKVAPTADPNYHNQEGAAY